MKIDYDKFQAMVTEASGWLDADNQDNRDRFIASDMSELVAYHSTIGRRLRNHFRLWEIAWEPDIKNGFDESPDHPDSISMRVIEELWRLRQGKRTTS